MNKKYRYLLIYIFMLLVPIYVFAYDKVIPGGETIGIEVHSKGVLVVGFYEVNGRTIAKDSGFKIGDTITKVNNKNIYNINEMLDGIKNSNSNKVKFSIIRNGKSKEFFLNLEYDAENVLKTGLYVKDQINGLGTLSFILEDNKFGSLGHEILESSTLRKFDISEGEIYDASVEGFVKSYDGSAGEKNANYDHSDITGKITNNEETGIYGEYSKDISDREFVSIKQPDEVNLGSATIRTVLKENVVEEFSIQILSIDKKSSNKNILFEITDDRLLNETGGVVQGMSGSPIMQDNKMVGVVNYVIVNDTKKGYGIFVTSMLEEIE